MEIKELIAQAEKQYKFPDFLPAVAEEFLIAIQQGLQEGKIYSSSKLTEIFRHEFNVPVSSATINKWLKEQKKNE